MSSKVPALVLGGSGYVAGEAIRFLLTHPHFELALVSSHSNAGKRLDDLFTHLTGPIGDRVFVGPEETSEFLAKHERAAVFSALPHGETARILGPIVAAAKPGIHVVDMSADFRFREAAAYEKVYKQPHEATDALDAFYCGAPDLVKGVPAQHISHPGCFATGTTLACAPLVHAKLTNGAFFVSAVTGSTGSGASPKPGTHHPTRNDAMWAYEPLKHRHTPEIKMMLERLTDQSVDLTFVPHSGPFSRGIHVTAMAKFARPATLDDVLAACADLYADNPFIKFGVKMPSLREVTGTNRCHLGVAVQGDDVVITSVVDNLVKGAAGGAIQWMNRLFEFDEQAGLNAPGVGWA